jgi:hypothetical protein
MYMSMLAVSAVDKAGTDQQQQQHEGKREHV